MPMIMTVKSEDPDNENRSGSHSSNPFALNAAYSRASEGQDTSAQRHRLGITDEDSKNVILERAPPTVLPRSIIQLRGCFANQPQKFPFGLHTLRNRTVGRLAALLNTPPPPDLRLCPSNHPHHHQQLPAPPNDIHRKL
ncbi:hypothetical protein PtA15_5A433 [Puccinia triticina]|uniref:Uncharacterized protein n=1 Tax=Puccinia triticina TaxID=208348 RepID=A0ABY7CM20_9BASI|nr:uncharacterized protein PtA15_5A433 [Puccinia triticina]WAQ84860.1 hypothetical protein PtA15_5A433 [Puccinia triticina]WAR58208.1 hypothetical protein PtB15_5B440 [Puccinia triticina]